MHQSIESLPGGRGIAGFVKKNPDQTRTQGTFCNQKPRLMFYGRWLARDTTWHVLSRPALKVQKVRFLSFEVAFSVSTESQWKLTIVVWLGFAVS